MVRPLITERGWGAVGKFKKKEVIPSVGALLVPL